MTFIIDSTISVVDNEDILNQVQHLYAVIRTNYGHHVACECSNREREVDCLHRLHTGRVFYWTNIVARCISGGCLSNLLVDASTSRDPFTRP